MSETKISCSCSTCNGGACTCGCQPATPEARRAGCSCGEVCKCGAACACPAA